MAQQSTKRTVRCYLCGAGIEVSAQTMSTTCAGCHKAIKVEDLVVKSYIPVVALQTCGSIKITKRGRVAAKRIQCGGELLCDGSIEGDVETDGYVQFGPKSSWKGKTLRSRSLQIANGAKLIGVITVPHDRPDPEKPKRPTKKKKKKVVPKRVTAPTTRTGAPKKTTAKKKAKTEKKPAKVAKKKSKTTRKTAKA